jgi:hypothetical protein
MRSTRKKSTSEPPHPTRKLSFFSEFETTDANSEEKKKKKKKVGTKKTDSGVVPKPKKALRRSSTSALRKAPGFTQGKSWKPGGQAGADKGGNFNRYLGRQLSITDLS